MDEVIFEEFKGTGNWELWLDRRLSEKRVFPSIDIQKSGTRRDDLLLDEQTHQRVVLLRRMTALVGQNSSNPTESTELILERLSRTKTNAGVPGNPERSHLGPILLQISGRRLRARLEGARLIARLAASAGSGRSLRPEALTDPRKCSTLVYAKVDLGPS